MEKEEIKKYFEKMAREFPNAKKLWMFMLIQDGMTLTELKKESGMHYTYLHEIVKDLEERNFIRSEKIGRNKVLTLTDKGNIISILLLLLAIEYFKSTNSVDVSRN